MNKILLLKKIRKESIPAQPDIKLICIHCKSEMILIDIDRNGSEWICNEDNKRVYIAGSGNFGA